MKVLIDGLAHGIENHSSGVQYLHRLDSLTIRQYHTSRLHARNVESLGELITERIHESMTRKLPHRDVGEAHFQINQSFPGIGKVFHHIKGLTHPNITKSFDEKQNTELCLLCPCEFFGGRRRLLITTDLRRRTNLGQARGEAEPGENRGIDPGKELREYGLRKHLFTSLFHSRTNTDLELLSHHVTPCSCESKLPHKNSYGGEFFHGPNFIIRSLF